MRQTDTGALIAQLRKEQGLTQKQLAEQLGEEGSASGSEEIFFYGGPHGGNRLL